MNEKIYTVLCPFGGLGAGALGFLHAETRLFGGGALVVLQAPEEGM